MRPGTLVNVTLCLSIVSLAACDRTARERIHAEHLAKAAEFKRQFDDQLPQGSPLAAVDDYLQDKPVTVVRSLDFLPQSGGGHRRVIGRLMIETAKEKSLIFGCGSASVGVVAQFTNEERLEKSEVTSWSFDCM